MRRFLLAVGFLLLVAASESRAGYYIVRIVLEGGGGAGGGVEGGPMVGSLPGVGPGVAGSGGRGGVQGGGPVPGGFPGPGGMGFQPPMGEGPGSNVVPVAGDPTRSVVVVVPFTEPYSKQPFYLKDNPKQTWDYVLKHRFGRTNLFDDGKTFQLIPDFQDVPDSKQGLGPKGSRTFQSILQNRYNDWIRTRSDPEALYRMAVEALEHGYVVKAMDWADELLALCDQKKAPLSDQLTRFADAYRVVQGPMKARPVPSPEAEQWKVILSAQYNDANVRFQGHYALIYWDAFEAEQTAWLTRLEDNFRAFYLAHAFRGVPLKVPSHPLVAVLLKGADDFNPMRTDLAGPVPMSDGFVAPAYNLLVLSSERTDGVGRSFRMSNRNIFRGGLSRQTLLEGSGPKLVEVSNMNPMGPNLGPAGPRGGGQQPGVQPDPMAVVPQGMTKDEVAQAMTVAMVEKYDEDGTAVAAISCEGSRQLLYSSELFPLHVDLPVWLRIGAGSYYHRPRDPVYTPKEKDKAEMAIGLTTGYGRPNFALQYHLAQLDARRELNPDPAALLRNVVTDTYYVAAAAGRDADNPTNTRKEAPADEIKRLNGLAVKAHVTSWALYYYVAKNRPAELQAFLAELRRMPRDLALDGDTKLLLFARAFGLTNMSGTPDQAAMTAFAGEWLGMIKRMAPAYVTVEVTTPAPVVGAAVGPGVGPMGGPSGGRPAGPTGTKD